MNPVRPGVIELREAIQWAIFVIESNEPFLPKEYSEAVLKRLRNSVSGTIPRDPGYVFGTPNVTVVSA